MSAGRILLLAAVLVGVPAPAGAQPERRVFVVPVEGTAYPAALAHPDIGPVARAGGIALLAGDRLGARLLDLVPSGLDPVADVRLADLERAVSSSLAAEVLVIVAGSAGDEPAWLALASGEPDHVLAGDGRAGGLTSDTTGHGGLVAAVDVTPTVLTFLGSAVPEDMAGSPIRIEGEAPTALYERAIDYRRVAGPVGLTVLAAGIGSLVVGILLLLLLPGAVLMRHAVAILGLFSVALYVALVPASVLPSLTPAVVVVGLLLIGAVILAGALVAGRRVHAPAVAVVAGTGLALLVVDGFLGWPTEVTPLLGGGALLGVRFYGLGNSAAGIVLSGAILGAALLRPRPGVALLVTAALFAGLPFLGADLGGGVTLFAAAGLWFAWRVRERSGLVSVAIALGAAAAGAALLIAAHALWPAATHVSRAVEAGGLVGTFLDRLRLNVRATTKIWPVWLTVLGLPVWHLVAWQRWGPFRGILDARPWWRMAMMVLAIGGMIGYVLNDTYGTAAVTFVFLSAALVYPALRDRWTSG